MRLRHCSFYFKVHYCLASCVIGPLEALFMRYAYGVSGNLSD